jgi:parallel beta-helix repeat protein
LWDCYASSLQGSSTWTGRSYLNLGGRGSGIHIRNSERNTLAGNTITQVRDGMYLQNTYHSVIRGNRIFNLRCAGYIVVKQIIFKAVTVVPFLAASMILCRRDL